MLHQKLPDVTTFIADGHAVVCARLEQELRVAHPAGGDHERLLGPERQQPLIAGVVAEVPQPRDGGT